MHDLISVVIPVYNSENSLTELYSALTMIAAKNKFDFEIIFIDDNSSDKSYEQILKLQKKDKKVKGIRLAKNFGQQNAIFCGFKYAVGDYIITMDDDLQHQPSDIEMLYRKIKEGFDIVYAIPKNRKYNFYRKIGSKLRNLLFNLITPKKKNIRVSSFRIISRKLLYKVVSSQKNFIYISAIILAEKPKIANIFTEQQQRKYGNSNYTFLKLLKLFFKLYIYYGRLPILRYLQFPKEQYLIAESTFDLSKNDKKG